MNEIQKCIEDSVDKFSENSDTNTIYLVEKQFEPSKNKYVYTFDQHPPETAEDQSLLQYELDVDYTNETIKLSKYDSSSFIKMDSKLICIIDRDDIDLLPYVNLIRNIDHIISVIRFKEYINSLFGPKTVELNKKG